MTTQQWETIPEIPRDYYGRPMVIPPEGGKPVAYTRCTTFVSCLEDTYNLGKWQMRMVARGLSIREDLSLRVNSLGPEPDHEDPAFKKWKSEMDKLADQAVEAAKASGPANIGTALHALTERIDRGQRVEDVPKMYRQHLKAYQEKTDGWTHQAIERFMVNDDLHVGGTPDRLVNIPGHPGLIVADIKTGSIEYGLGKIAMQLAMYANSKMYDPATGHRTPMDIAKTRAVVIALNAQTGDCELKWVDLAAGWEAIQLCIQVRAWRARRNLTTPYEAAARIIQKYGAEDDPPPGGHSMLADSATPIRGKEVTDELAIFRAINDANTPDELTAMWRWLQPAGMWTPAMTDRATARKQQLLTTTQGN